MNQLKLHRLLRELTPEIRAYLFPGMPAGEPCPEEAGEKCHYVGTPLFCETNIASEEPEPEPEPKLELELEPEPAQASVAAEPKMKTARKRSPGIFGRVPQMAAAAIPGPAAAIPEEEQLNPRTEQILAEIRRLQAKYGVSIDELEILLGYTVQLSQLRIMRSGKIYLSAYDNTEVKMPNVAKSLYFLYLRHPEGLRFKEVADHKEELVSIYGSITGRDEPEEIEKSIDLLADPFSNALNVNASRIKTAFRNAVSDRVARFYYINGTAGDVKKVPLDRDLVIWEY